MILFRLDHNFPLSPFSTSFALWRVITLLRFRVKNEQWRVEEIPVLFPVVFRTNYRPEFSRRLTSARFLG